MTKKAPAGFSREEIMRRLERGYQSLKKRLNATYLFQFLTPKDVKYPTLIFSLRLSALLFTFISIFLLSIFLLVYSGTLGKLPNYSELKNIKTSTASEVYTADDVLLGKYYIENRSHAAIDEIPQDLINALIATEDARFFKHSGIDLRAWGRVLVKTIILSNESSGGGSTLSQQLAKNLYSRKQYWFGTLLINKFKEMLVARRLERIYTKEELLNLYLNKVPFGNNVFGVKVAAKRFFNKPSNNLKIEESAVLVGILKATTYFNPLRHKERAKQRRNVVLSQMARYEYISPAVADSLKQLELDLDPQYERYDEGSGTYFREYLRQALKEELKQFKKADGAPYNLYTDGLKIFTSIDAKMQRYAEEAVASHMANLQDQFNKNWKGRKRPWEKSKLFQKMMRSSKRYQSLEKQGYSTEVIDSIFQIPVSMQVFSWATESREEEMEMSPMDSLKYYIALLQAGFLALDPQSGKIKAWVGGIDFKYFQYDHVKSRRQIGSIFKPVVFAAALQNGMLPCEYTHNRLTTYSEFEDWQPKNADRTYGGVYSMEGALSKSINTSAVEIMFRAGLDTVRQLATDMGIQSPIPTGPAIALGAIDASLYEMVNVYATFANQGKRPQFRFIERIETPDGKVLVSYEEEVSNYDRVLTQQQAGILTEMMQTVVDSGTAKRLRTRYRLYHPIAGKTGTTQNHSDGWFIGFTPNLVAGAWVGAESPKVHFRTLYYGQGANTALPIWGKFLQKVKNDKTLRNWVSKRFPLLPDSVSALMQCPPYLEEMPILEDEWLAENYNNLELIDQILAELEPGENFPVYLRSQRLNETDAEYRRRLLRYYERLQRRKKRKEKSKAFWKNLFRKKNKNERRNN